MEQLPSLSPQQRAAFSYNLPQQEVAMRSVVSQEERRVGHLIHDTRTEADSELADIRTAHAEIIADTLEESRENIRRGVVKGIDDVAVDIHLGLRTDESIVPQHFQRLHEEAEKQQGEPLTFLTWMADHATDEQLKNVWQWHDNYLKELDNAPEFQEQVAKIKQDYIRGTKEAVQSGVLHSDMLLADGAMESVTVAHASPLAPQTAGAKGTAHPLTNQVLVRPDADERLLFHEFTHIVKPGFIPILAEGPTDMIAAASYRHAHPGEKYAAEEGSYNNQVAFFASLDHLTEGHMDLREVSRLYAGTDPETNTVRLLKEVDNTLAAPIMRQAVIDTRHLLGQRADSLSSGDMALMSHYFLRQHAEVLEDAYFDDRGQKIHHNVDTLLRSLVSDRMLRYHEESVLKHTFTVIVQAEDYLFASSQAS